MDELTTKEAAEILGISPSRIRQFILEKRLPATKHGRDLFILKKDLVAMERRPPGRPKKR